MGHAVSFHRVAAVATLPSALFDERFGSLGASWVFWFQPVLPAVYRPRFHLEDESWARRLTQSPELGFRLWLSQRVLVYAAAGIARCFGLRTKSARFACRKHKMLSQRAKHILFVMRVKRFRVSQRISVVSGRLQQHLFMAQLPHSLALSNGFENFS